MQFNTFSNNSCTNLILMSVCQQSQWVRLATIFRSLTLFRLTSLFAVQCVWNKCFVFSETTAWHKVWRLSWPTFPNCQRVNWLSRFPEVMNSFLQISKGNDFRLFWLLLTCRAKTKCEITWLTADAVIWICICCWLCFWMLLWRFVSSWCN